MQEIAKFGTEVNIIPNGLEKYFCFMSGKPLVFINSTDFMNSGLKNLVKNLSKNDFKFLKKRFLCKQIYGQF